MVVISPELRKDLDLAGKVVDTLVEWTDYGRYEIHIGSNVVPDFDVRDFYWKIQERDTGPGEFFFHLLSLKCLQENPDFQMGRITLKYERNRYYLAYIPPLH